MRCVVGELVVLPGRFDVAEGAEERAVGVGGGSSAEAVGDRRDLDRGLGGVDVAEVDPGQLLPVESLAELGEVDGPRRRGRGARARAARRRASAAAKSAIASGSSARSPRFKPDRPSRTWRAISSSAPRAMPRGTAASIGRMMLNTGIRQSGASGHASPTNDAAVLGIDLHVIGGDVVAAGAAQADDVPGVLDRDVGGAHEDEAWHGLDVVSPRRSMATRPIHSACRQLLTNGQRPVSSSRPPSSSSVPSGANIVALRESGSANTSRAPISLR